MRIGMLTGGGDCPGLNAVIRAAVRKGILHYNDEFVGFEVLHRMQRATARNGIDPYLSNFTKIGLNNRFNKTH